MKTDQPLDFKAPWQYHSQPDFRVLRRVDVNGVEGVWAVREAPFLEYAVGMFCELGLPMERECAVLVVDAKMRVVLGYSTLEGGIEGTGMAWWGTRETFEVLQRWSTVDPLDLAVWESIARRYVE